jgi:hypothetical protein
MDKCVRCKRDLGLGSVVITKVEGDRLYMAHFLCATATEVKALYGNFTPYEFPLVEEPKKQLKGG